MDDKVYPQRTKQQNKSLWLLFTQLADQLNDSGLYMQKVLKAGVEIQWNKDMVHDYLWVPVMKAQVNKTSTKDMTVVEVDKVFETINKHIGEKFGLVIDFPSIETISLQQLTGDNK